MELVLLLSVLAACSATTTVKEEPCEDVTVHGKSHKKQTLAMGLNRPYQLSIYKQNLTIFFSANVGSDTEDTFEIAYLKEGAIEPERLNFTKNGFATAVDEEHELAYFGGSEGIDIYQLKSGEIHKLVPGVDVWDFFFKKHLYYIEYPSQHLYKYENKKSKRHKTIHEEILHFAIDGDDDIFITNKTGVYHIKKGSSTRVYYDGPKIFRGIEVNNKGIAHFLGQNGIYVPSKHNKTLIEVAHIKNIFGLTFDKHDNIIYSTPLEIIRLLPEECT